MISALAILACLIIVLLVAWFLVQKIDLPEPGGKIVQIAVVVVIAIVCIALILHVAGVAPFPMLLR